MRTHGVLGGTTAVSLLLVITVVVNACVPPASTGPAPQTAASGGSGVSCDATCAHMLGCAGLDGPDTRVSCNQDCAGRRPTTDQLEALQEMTCEQLAAMMNGGGNTGGGGVDWSGGGGGGAPQGGGGGCTADCTGCVGDGSSCYHGTGLACDDCCCAPGGPSPTWE